MQAKLLEERLVILNSMALEDSKTVSTNVGGLETLVMRSFQLSCVWS
jgi:hypothetical protein